MDVFHDCLETNDKISRPCLICTVHWLVKPGLEMTKLP